MHLVTWKHIEIVSFFMPFELLFGLKTYILPLFLMLKMIFLIHGMLIFKKNEENLFHYILWASRKRFFFFLNNKELISYIVGCCRKNTVLLPTEAKSCLHIIWMWDNFLGDSQATCIFWWHCHLQG